eukprot:scaffold23.g4134.t1
MPAVRLLQQHATLATPARSRFAAAPRPLRIDSLTRVQGAGLCNALRSGLRSGRRRQPQLRAWRVQAAIGVAAVAFDAGAGPFPPCGLLLPLSGRAALWLSLHAGLAAACVAMLRTASQAYVDLFFLYYQPFLPLLAMLWLWGLNLRFFERCGVPYQMCFPARDRAFLLPSSSVFQICNVLSAAVLTSGAAFLRHCCNGSPAAAAVHPPLLYAGLLALLLFPGRLLFRDTRRFFGATLWRVLTPLSHPLSWADFLLADVLTSLAKALSDTERALCHLLSGAVMTPRDAPWFSDASLLIPLGLALPYALRCAQCLRAHADTGSRSQLVNALKYGSAFPVIALSFAKYHVSAAAWNGRWWYAWMGAALLNSAFSYYWDVECDWDLGISSWLRRRRAGGEARGGEAARHGTAPAGAAARAARRPLLPAQRLYSPRVYAYLLVSNLVLRLAWAHKLSPHLRSERVVILLFAVLEAVRRFQWLFVRIEVELRRLHARRGETIEVGMLVPVPSELLSRSSAATAGAAAQPSAQVQRGGIGTAAAA